MYFLYIPVSRLPRALFSLRSLRFSLDPTAHLDFTFSIQVTNT